MPASDHPCFGGDWDCSARESSVQRLCGCVDLSAAPGPAVTLTPTASAPTIAITGGVAESAHVCSYYVLIGSLELDFWMG